MLALADMTTEQVSSACKVKADQIAGILAQVSFQNGLLLKLKPSAYSLVDLDKFNLRDKQSVIKRLGIAPKPSLPHRSGNNVIVADDQPVKKPSPSDINRLADQRIKQMMKSKRKR